MASSRILVADEDPRDSRPLGSLLESGYDLIHARSGQEALALLAASATAERVRADVVLLDATVPGLSGFEVCEKIRTLPETRHVPIVLVTAMASPDERARAIRSGADEILSRPVDPIELLTRVRSLFRFKRLRDEREAARREFESRRAEVKPPADGRASLADLVAQDLIDPLVNQVCRVNINSQCQRGPDSFPFTGRKDSAEGTLSVSDALRVFTIRTLVAAKSTEANKRLITESVRQRKSSFLSTDFIL